ncbi:hypothetical protein E1301_Tti012827 [Triplophysa tibetana]|uniref:Uncharacterized protein n=1 Tax=Triplophysa tibetana TaxID=1572043 RepID=A0A5A9NQ29_9TELE|nr:hypothetical protein E1301_Tti012827 [Triplophysa tibetana]
MNVFQSASTSLSHESVYTGSGTGKAHYKLTLKTLTLDSLVHISTVLRRESPLGALKGRPLCDTSKTVDSTYNTIDSQSLKEAVIRCKDCLPKPRYCGKCDVSTHQHLVFHNRETLIDGFYIPIPPSTAVQDFSGQNIIYEQGSQAALDLRSHTVVRPLPRPSVSRCCALTAQRVSVGQQFQKKLRKKTKKTTDISQSRAEQPKQPHLKIFPRTYQGDRRRCFSKDWYNTHKWLEYSQSKDSAYCYACRQFSLPSSDLTRTGPSLESVVTRTQTTLDSVLTRT